MWDDVRGWWLEEIDGGTDKFGAEFSTTTKTFIKPKDERVPGPKTRLIFSLGSVEITPRYPSPI
jgi:hypothetical protein